MKRNIITVLARSQSVLSPHSVIEIFIMTIKTEVIYMLKCTN